METTTSVEVRDAVFPEGTPERLRTQFDFYNQGSARHFTKFKRWKAAQIVAGAAIPISAVLIPEHHEIALRSTTASLGAFVAAVESYVQFRQFHQNWIRWRTAAEALRREAFLYAGKAGIYRSIDAPEVVLTESIEEIIGMEQRSWKSLQENPHPGNGEGPSGTKH